MVFMGSGGGVSLCQTEYYGRIIENSLPINCRGGGGGGGSGKVYRDTNKIPRHPSPQTINDDRSLRPYIPRGRQTEVTFFRST